MELFVLFSVLNGNKNEVFAKVELVRMGRGLKRGGRFKDVLCDSSSGCCVNRGVDSVEGRRLSSRVVDFEILISCTRVSQCFAKFYDILYAPQSFYFPTHEQQQCS